MVISVWVRMRSASARAASLDALGQALELAFEAAKAVRGELEPRFAVERLLLGLGKVLGRTPAGTRGKRMAETASSNLQAAGIPRINAKEIEGLPKKSEEPLLVVFVAEWGEVSRDEAPVLGRIAKRLEGKVRFAFADVDGRAGDAARLDVRSVPAAIIFAKERELNRKVGAATEDELADLIDKALEEYAKIDEAKKDEDDAKDDVKDNDDETVEPAPVPEGDEETAGS